MKSTAAFESEIRFLIQSLNPKGSSNILSSCRVLVDCTPMGYFSRQKEQPDEHTHHPTPSHPTDPPPKHQPRFLAFSFLHQSTSFSYRTPSYLMGYYIPSPTLHAQEVPTCYMHAYLFEQYCREIGVRTDIYFKVSLKETCIHIPRGTYCKKRKTQTSILNSKTHLHTVQHIT